MIGVTIWRLRPARPADSPEARLLLQDNDGGAVKTEWTPERVEADTSFVAGEPIRLAIESPRSGFMYVIDRERYADGSTSDPYLIFPTLRIRAGDNAVMAGRVIELPEGSAFRFKPLRTGYAGELLTVVVTKEPLIQLAPGPGAKPLDRAMVEQLERQWMGVVERFELANGAGGTYTVAEREAASQKRLLTQDDALPQTLFRAVGPSDGPLVVPVLLRVSGQ